ncbi:MAG: PKD domain-containing protein, partial [Flavobacteriales bacterium]
MFAALRTIAIFTMVIAWSPICTAQFANAYVHLMSDDHTAVVQSIAKKHYIQASTTMGTTKDIHLMKIDAGGNVVLDKIFFSPSGNEVALDVCRGNNHTYLICGYEQVGGLDLGFVLQVDTNFNFVAKVNIQVPGNNRHTPALNIINSAFYQQPNPNLYFLPDPAGGYLITGFEAVGYNPTDPKSGYALKLTDALTFQWMAKLDSPIPLGSPDWDMCSHGTYMWAGAKSYFVGGSGTSPTGGQVAMATEISMSGALMWTKIYHDTNVAGHTSVAAAAAFDDQPVPMELYQITNHSLVQGGGFITFEQGTGNIIFPKTRHIVTSTPGYYLYEFGSTCASSTVLISGYGHNQTAGSTTGFFPFTFRYAKDTTQAVDPGIKYAYPVQSAGYNPNTTIYDSYQTGGHPRIFYPKLFGQLAVNEMAMAAFEDIGTEQENYVVHPNMNGGNACDSIDPGFVSTPINIIEGPANHQLDTFVVTPGTYTDVPLASTVQVCNNCTVDPNFTISPGAACNYTFTANNPNVCALFTVYDISNNVLFTANAGTANYTFGTSGTYTICYSDCRFGTNGVTCRDTLCQTIQVTCPTPCPLDADFTFNVSGCCVSFQDLTPDGNPGGCEYWTFGNIQVTMAGDITSFCFPGSGTYTVCHVDCCTDASGVTTYHQVCKQVTVNCTPPCCLPTGINVTTSNCCISASPVLPGGCTGSNVDAWTLSPGNFSTQANPTFCNLGSGFYTICLWAYCGKGNWTKFCKTVKVSCALPPPPPPGGGGGTAKFSYNLNGTSIGLTPSPPPANLQITSHTWTFGDGQTSTAAAPSHYYLRSGSYPITHSVEGIDLGTGMPFTAEQTVQVTMALAPACGCVPPELDAMAGGELVCDGDNTVLLKLIDFASESDIEHQWMRSTCSGSGCPTSQFVEVPGAIGQHVWIDDVSTTSYFRCRSTSALGLVTWSNEVEVVQGEFDLNVSGPAGAICPGVPSALTATNAETYEWSTGETTSSITVSPVTSTTYSVDATNAAGCMDGEDIAVVIGGTDLVLEVKTDGNGSQTTWELRQQGTNTLVQSGGGTYQNNVTLTDGTCLPNGCYYLVVLDSGGDGILNGGGYILRTLNGAQRIIDNRGNFNSGAVSAVINNGGFCLPLGGDKLIFTSCDKMDWVSNQFIVAEPNPAVSAQFGVTNTTSGYQFWWFDPNGTYGYSKFRSHATSDGFGTGATRACHARINNWSPAQIPANVMMNVKVRGRVNGNNLPWGPVCRFMIDPVRAACPFTKLVDIPGNANFSCGVTRTWGGSSLSKVVAKAVDGATQYQFRWNNSELAAPVIRTTTTPVLQLNWTPALPNGTYQVQVRAFKNGVWCATSLPWGDECNVTITGSTAMGLNGGNTVATGDAKLAMFPNP